MPTTRCELARGSLTRASEARPQSCSTPKSFTLVELLVVMALIGLIVTLVSVRLTGTTDSARLRGAALRIEQTLRLARLGALTRHAPIRLELTIGAGRYRLVSSNVQANDPETPWQSLEPVVLASARMGRQRDAAAGEPFVVTTSATGATLPWSAELRTGRQACSIASDGITGRLVVQENASARSGVP